MQKSCSHWHKQWPVRTARQNSLQRGPQMGLFRFGFKTTQKGYPQQVETPEVSGRPSGMAGPIAQLEAVVSGGPLCFIPIIFPLPPHLCVCHAGLFAFASFRSPCFSHRAYCVLPCRCLGNSTYGFHTRVLPVPSMSQRFHPGPRACVSE